MAEPITQVLGIVGIKNRGEYNSETTYEKLNTVRYQGQTYCAKTNTQGNLPTNTLYWDLMVEKGEKGDMPVKGVDYWTETDKAEIEADLSSDVTSEVTEQLGNITSTTPTVVNSASSMTDTSKIYVLSTDGHWYWNNGTNWVDGGVYQATEISEENKLYKKVSKLNYYLSENFLKENSIFGYYGSQGQLVESTTYKTTDFIEVPAYCDNTLHYTNTYSALAFTEWDENKNFIRSQSPGTDTNITLKTTTKYVRATFKPDGDVQLIFRHIKKLEELLTKYNLSKDNIVDLFTVKNSRVGYYSSSGNFISSDKYGATDFIEIPRLSKTFEYVTSSNELLTYTFWDENKSFVSGGTFNTTVKSSIPDNAKYIIMGFMQNTQNDSHLYFNTTESIEKIDSPKINENLTNIFQRVGVVGDSLSVGYIYNTETETANNRMLDYSWPQFMARKLNRTWRNYGFSGATSKSWFSNQYGKDLLINEDSCQAYVICMGVNDSTSAASYPVGTSSDINLSDMEQNGDSFYGWYGKIIQTIKLKNSKAKIFVATKPYPYNSDTSRNTAIRDMANIFENVYVVDLANNYNEYFTSGPIRDDRLHSHNTAIGYSALANVYNIAINDIIKNNISDFQNVAFI